MRILRNIDIEDAIRVALANHIQAYCRPLPQKPVFPCILVQRVGGTDTATIDTFEVVLDSRAKTEAEADLTLRNAIGILRTIAARRTTPLRHITVNTSGSWGVDPVRPDLAMCSARISVTAHLENVEV